MVSKNPRRTLYGSLTLAFTLATVDCVTLGILGQNRGHIAGWLYLAAGIGFGLFAVIYGLAWRRRRGPSGPRR